MSNFESAAARLATLSTGSGHDLKGRISRESLVRLDFDDGSTIIAPEAVMMQKGTIWWWGTCLLQDHHHPGRRNNDNACALPKEGLGLLINTCRVD